MKLQHIVAVLVGFGLPSAVAAMLVGAVRGFQHETLYHVAIAGNHVHRWHSHHSASATLSVAGICGVCLIFSVVVAALLANGFWNDWRTG